MDERELARKTVAHYTRRSEEGDNEALLHALFWSNKHDVPLPYELRVVLNERLERYLLLDARTLDEAFGVKRAKGMRLSDQRRRNRLEIPVYNEVECLREQMPIDEALEMAAKKHGTSKTVAAELYYEVRQHVEAEEWLTKGMSPE